MTLSQITKVASRRGLASRLRTAEVGGFLPVRSRACNLESGHSVYGVAGPEDDGLLLGPNMRYWTLIAPA